MTSSPGSRPRTPGRRGAPRSAQEPRGKACLEAKSLRNASEQLGKSPSVRARHLNERLSCPGRDAAGGPDPATDPELSCFVDRFKPLVWSLKTVSKELSGEVGLLGESIRCPQQAFPPCKPVDKLKGQISPHWRPLPGPPPACHLNHATFPAGGKPSFQFRALQPRAGVYNSREQSPSNCVFGFSHLVSAPP